MIVGSVSSPTLRRQAEGNGAHRTAGPDHTSGSSDPMYPMPLYARTPDRFAVKGEVYHSTVSAHVGCGVGSLLVSERKLIRVEKT
jgi:hypothetical protein